MGENSMDHPVAGMSGEQGKVPGAEAGETDVGGSQRLCVPYEGT